MKQFDQPIRVKSMDGKETILLKNNEPRPDLEVRVIDSRIVKLDPSIHSLTILRLEVEHILHQGCAHEQLGSLVNRGNQVADILLKIADSFQNGNACCDNCLNRAVAAMQYFAQPKIQEWLINTASKRNASIGLRAQAVLSLGQMKSLSSERLLFQLLNNDKDAAIRKAAVYALHQNIKPEYFKSLIERLKKEKSSGVKQQLIYTVRSIIKQYNLTLPAKFPGLSRIKASAKPLPLSPKIKLKK